MLDLVENILRDNGYYLEVELRTLIDSPCTTSTIKVLKFDKIKEKYCYKFCIGNVVKSNDLLILFKKKNELHFIEMKRCNGLGAQAFTNKYFEQPKIRDKNIHSIFLFLSLISTYNIDKDFYTYFFHLPYPKKIKLRTSILCDLPEEEMIYAKLLTMGSSGAGFHEIMAGQVDIINCSYFEKYFS